MLVPIPTGVGYPALAALILGESAGLPLPGETALITAAGLASGGVLSLPLVIAVAAVAAIIGDTLGYWIGRRRGRAFLLRDGALAGHRRRAVSRADRFFVGHGSLTVLVSRFIPGVRVVAAVMAGTTQMSYRRFAVANTCGAVLWATAVGGLAHAAGPHGAAAIAVGGLALLPTATVVAWLRRRLQRRRTPVVAAF